MLPPEPMDQPSEGVRAALLEFLRTSSRTALLSFRLAKQNEVANLRRELAALTDQLLDAQTTVELVSLFVEPPRVPRALSPGAVGSALVQRARRPAGGR